MYDQRIDMISTQQFIAEKRDDASNTYIRSLVKLSEGAVLPNQQTYTLEQTKTQSLESNRDIVRQTYKTVSAPNSYNQSKSITLDTTFKQRYIESGLNEKVRPQPCLLSILIQVADLNKTIRC